MDLIIDAPVALDQEISMVSPEFAEFDLANVYQTVDQIKENGK